MLLYNNPGRVGYTLSANLVERLAHEVSNIVGMKDTSGDITQTSEFIRRNRDIGFKVFGGKDTLLYASLCHGAVGGVCTAANFMPELITDVYNKYAAGDLEGSLEAQFKLNPVRLSMDGSKLSGSGQGYGQPAGTQYRSSLHSEPCNTGRTGSGQDQSRDDKSRTAVIGTDKNKKNLLPYIDTINRPSPTIWPVYAIFTE